MSHIGSGAQTSQTGIGGELTADEESVVQDITSGDYFVFNETPTGSIDGSNSTFTLAYIPNPSSSLVLILQGQLQVQGSSDQYTLSGNTITFNADSVPVFGMRLKAPFYTVSPV